jgi:hypothetical protein
MLLPSTPRIIPQLPTLNQTIEVQAAPACNETEINLNRTANQTRLSCNATTNGTNASNPDPTASLPGLSFFDNLKVSADSRYECQQLDCVKFSCLFKLLRCTIMCNLRSRTAEIV